MGKTYKTELDLATIKKLLSKKPNCTECGSKTKIYKETTFEGHGTYEAKGYLGNIDDHKGVFLNKRKKVYLDQDIYDIKYKYKCPNCGKIYELDAF